MANTIGGSGSIRNNEVGIGGSNNITDWEDDDRDNDAVVGNDYGGDEGFVTPGPVVVVAAAPMTKTTKTIEERLVSWEA